MGSFKGLCEHASMATVAWLGSRSAFGMAATMAIVVAGVCASLFTESIRNSGSSWIPAPNDAAGAWLFWLMVFLAALLFWVNHAALTRKSDKARMDLETAVKRLNTVPSEIFLPTYSRCWKQAAGLTLACIAAKGRDGLSRGVVEEAIKAVQAAILESAKDFDNADEAWREDSPSSHAQACAARRLLGHSVQAQGGRGGTVLAAQHCSARHVRRREHVAAARPDRLRTSVSQSNVRLSGRCA